MIKKTFTKECFHSHINTQTIAKFPDRLITRRACLRLISKHTLPRLARSTLDKLKQNQHEKASLVCVRVQSPSGLALVPCALSMVDLSGQLRCRITHTSLNHTHKHPWYRIMFGFLFLAPYARTTRCEEAFFSLENQGKIDSLRSRAS